MIDVNERKFKFPVEHEGTTPFPLCHAYLEMNEWERGYEDEL